MRHTNENAIGSKLSYEGRMDRNSLSIDFGREEIG